eukprot:TRINITY_DN7_c0_g1_i7.p1 TRINITY_DN7_c0_g1~~TRINITY_DN7_c0_g1_i7.p1  ORF type:complete len:510 (-),score=138.91 TRINITY_DN7_c0_g1_i7:170-1699(-)
MTPRKFVILCMLRFVVGVRPKAEEEEGLLANEGRRRGCDEDKTPTKEATTYCASFDNPEQCRANDCRSVDMMTETGALVCLAKCKTVTSDGAVAGADPSFNDSPVPQEVKDAVQAARALVQEKATAAQTKVQQAIQAQAAARSAMAALQAKQEEADEQLTRAKAVEAEALAIKIAMEAAIEEAKRTDTEVTAQSSAYEAAVEEKKQKKIVMMQKLHAKQDKEAQWNMEDKGFADEITDINQKLPKLQQQLLDLDAEYNRRKEAINAAMAEATMRRAELAGKRSENRNTRQTEGQRIADDYKESLNSYKQVKDRVEELAAAAQNARAASQEATGSARAKVKEYWRKVAALDVASDKKATAQEEAESARREALHAQFAHAELADQMARASKERDDFEELKIKVEGVYEYAVVFYNKLGEVQQPNGNPMMNVMLLVKDPAMKPCLASYNTIITAANDLAQVDQQDIISKLKAGLTKIDQDRYTHFKQWCGDEDFVRWIWGANELTKVELAID